LSTNFVDEPLSTNLCRPTLSTNFVDQPLSTASGVTSMLTARLTYMWPLWFGFEPRRCEHKLEVQAVISFLMKFASLQYVITESEWCNFSLFCVSGRRWLLRINKHLAIGASMFL